MNPSSKKPNKHLGQNFLVNESIKKKILECCEFTPEDTVLEIGPGEGALTELFYLDVRKVIAVEKDKKLAEKLKDSLGEEGVDVVHQDFLKFNLSKLPPQTKIIGNLPYNLSTPIITKILEKMSHFSGVFLTVQLEFGERLASQSNSKIYGAFSCFVQYHCDVELLFKIPNSAFWPVPKVQSCFLKLTPKRKTLTDLEEKRLFRLIHEGFKQRRKKLINSLLTFRKREDWLEIFDRLKIDPSVRAENLSLEMYIQLVKALPKKDV